MYDVQKIVITREKPANFQPSKNREIHLATVILETSNLFKLIHSK